MIKFYYNTGPNPMKVALFLEEANIDYEAIPVDTRKGEQHKDNYLYAAHLFLYPQELPRNQCLLLLKIKLPS